MLVPVRSFSRHFQLCDGHHQHIRTSSATIVSLSLPWLTPSITWIFHIPTPKPSAVRSLRRALRGRLLALCFLATGCVQTYQPMTGLHRPIVVDTKAANLVDMSVTVHCVPGDKLGPQDAARLCRSVGALFTNQGAQVRTVSEATLRTADALDSLGAAGDSSSGAELIVELRSRRVHESNDPLLWLLCYSTFTFVPAVTEFSFAQDVTIRDGDGFLLVTDTLEGRLIRRFGISVWAGNKLLDWLWREDGEKLTKEAANLDLSDDLYGQLSQLVFNAKMQQQVLLEATPEGPPWR